MRTECLPLEAIPGIAKLFQDYSHASPKAFKFYEAKRQSPKSDDFPFERRAPVADVLLRQNQNWGATAKTLQNIESLRKGASAIVTGQQVALFGGPMFAILKAITACKQAEAVTRAGVDCVPIFWLATEDHDLAEVSSVTLLEDKGVLRKYSLSSDVKEGGPVGGVEFGPKISELVEEAARTFADSEIADILRQCYQPGATFANAFAKLFTRLFSDFGLILLDPADKALHEIAKPILVDAAEAATGLNVALLERGKALEAAGYHAQVKVTHSSTLLFALADEVRTPVHRVNGGFAIGKEKLSSKELIARVAAHPEKFSSNALLRPVVQDYLLPTLAYIGGPAEVAYFAQSEVVYKKVLGRVTPILPRISATFVDAKVERLLKKYGITVPGTFLPAEELKRKLAALSLPASLASQFEETRNALQVQLALLGDGLQQLDPTLAEAAKRSTSKMMYQLSRLKSRAGSAEARKNADIARHAAQFSNSLYPLTELQERGIAGISFLGKHGTGMLRQICDALDLDCAGHQVLYL